VRKSVKIARYYNQHIGKFTTVDPLTLELTGDKFKDKQNLWTFLSDPQRLNGYSYANDNPVVNYDPDGNSTVAAWLLNPAITFTQVMTWKFGSDVYRLSGKQATVDLLQHSLVVNPSNIEIKENNHYAYIIDEIKGSPEYRQLVSDSIESAQKRGKSDFQTASDVSLEFKSGDLFTSLHKVTPSISGKLVNGEWQLTSKITDVYDFNYNNYNNWPVDIANNSALISNYTGSISNYNIDIQFNEKIKNKK